MMDLLKKVAFLEQEASSFGFAWENTNQIMQQIQNECEEVQEHLQNSDCNPIHLQEEIGDLLHAVFSLCIFCKFDPKQTLEQSASKFEKRFNTVKSLASDRGLSNLREHSFEELMSYWDKAKALVG